MDKDIKTIQLAASDKNSENTGKKRRMGKAPRIILWCVAIVLLMAVLAVAGRIIYVSIKGANFDTTDERYTALAEENKEISYNQKTGMLYVNNEVILLASSAAGENDIRALAQLHGAEIADCDPDLGFYLLRLSDNMSLKELESLVAELKENELVDNAFINPVIDGQGDSAKAIYPDDPWETEKWNVSNPSGDNWGMEAIDAPGAWAYLDKMSTVKIGIIDSLVTTEHEDLDISVFLTTHQNGTNDYSTAQYRVEPDEAGDHGCHVAGIIGATWNNSTGVSGVMGNKAEMYNSVVSSFGSGSAYVDGYYSAYDYVKAIQVLTDQGVRAINISQNTSRLIGFAASRGNDNAINILTTQAEIAGSMLKRLIEDIQSNGGDDFVIVISAGNSNSTTFYKDKSATYGYAEEQDVAMTLTPDSGNSEAKYNNFLALIDEPMVKDRIIVVGSVGQNTNARGLMAEKYIYSEYSCVGDRVDIVAPGDDICSLVTDGYATLSGTSMAAPHVTGVAGLAFATNPDLSGPEVKAILTGLSTGRYYYGEHYSGMVNARLVTEYILGIATSQNTPQIAEKAGLDLCFLIDTTGSMDDDINNAKANMVEILTNLADKSSDYRVAIIDYRDFPDRAGEEDYPAKVQLNFTSDNDTIVNAIYSLELGDGGDWEETVYSAIYEALRLNWRPRAQKILIILGDAGPLDPEPNTGYTYEDVVTALYNANIGVNAGKGDSHTLGDPADSGIAVFTIGIGDEAAEFFMNISGDTGGLYTEVNNASEVSSAIMESIEQIEIPTATVTASFGKEYSREKVALYTEDGDYVFSFRLDKSGKTVLENMMPGDYQWEMRRLAKSGEVRITLDSDKSKVREDDSPWYSIIYVLWYRHRIAVLGAAAGVVVLIAAIITLAVLLRKRKKTSRGKAKRSRDWESDTDHWNDPPETSRNRGTVCRKCGARVADGYRFCSECGSPVEDSDFDDWAN